MENKTTLDYSVGAAFLKNFERSATLVQPPDDQGLSLYSIPKAALEDAIQCSVVSYDILCRSRHLYAVAQGDLCYVYLNFGATEPTVSPFGVRLPKLPLLINLSPQDFFLLCRTLGAATITQGGTLILDAAALVELPCDSLFTKSQVNYTINYKYCSDTWVPLEAFAELAKMPPTPEHHLAAIQYLTSAVHPTTPYIPIQAIIDLELECEEATPLYAVNPFYKERR